MPKLPRVFARHQANVDLFTQYCTTHQNLIWGVSVASGITVGWMSYASRKYHHRQIETKFDNITKRLSKMERKKITDKYFYRIAMPLCISCLCIGYGIGRFHSSWRSYKNIEQWKGDFVNSIHSQLKTNKNITNYPMISDVINNLQNQGTQNNNLSSTSSYNPSNWIRK